MNLQHNFSSCFVCGIENPSGLQLHFWDNGKDQVFAHFTLDPIHAGYPGMAHGGIVTAVLDEVGGRTMIIGHPNRFFVAAHMNVHFRQPVPIGVLLDASGWLLKSSGRRTRAYAKIFTSGTGILAEANMLFTDMPASLLDPEKATHTFGWRLCD